jgi:hypothetical protein
MKNSHMGQKRYIFTVTTGRSGQETLANILNSSVDNVHASFEAPNIKTIFKGRLSNIEHKVRRRYLETNELLGRGKILKAYDNKDMFFINNIASKRVKMINKMLVRENKSIYVDVSKYFARGLHVGFCNILPKISIINLVRDPLTNMKSFINRQKNFILDNNLPDVSSNILQLNSSNMQKEELYLWAWCEMYLRFQYLKKKSCVSGYTEILTEKLNDNDYLTESLGLIDLQYNPDCHTKHSYNTNSSRGYAATSVSSKDVDVFYRFMERVPPNLIKKIPYLIDYDPESHIA